jgi:hypothetical protein
MPAAANSILQVRHNDVTIRRTATLITAIIGLSGEYTILGDPERNAMLQAMSISR